MPWVPVQRPALTKERGIKEQDDYFEELGLDVSSIKSETGPKCASVCAPLLSVDARQNRVRRKDKYTSK